MKTTVILIGIFIVLNGFNLHAQESFFPIDVYKNNGISYISGGIGTDERNALEKMGKDYSLKLMFAVKGGAYVAMLDVLIKNDKGKTVFEAVSRGPWLYAQMPSGNYTVSATYKGVQLQKPADVKLSPQSEVRFFWGN